MYLSLSLYIYIYIYVYICIYIYIYIIIGHGQQPRAEHAQQGLHGRPAALAAVSDSSQ